MATIIFYTHASPAALGQAEFYRQDLEALRALGHDVVVCTKYSQIPLNFDAMVVWWWTHALGPVLLCRLLKKPCVITGTFDFSHSEDSQGRDYLHRSFWQKLLIRAAVKLCSLNLFVSQLEFDQCSKYFGLTNGRFMPHCTSEDYLQGASPVRQKALFNVAWSSKANLIRKGIPELLDAVRLLKERGCEVPLYLAGMEGDGKSFILERIRHLGIENEVHYLGSLSREEKIRMLRECEVYVQPSRYEGFGLAVLESMGCGACVIVRDVGAVREVVGDAGLYLTSASPEELANMIEKALNDRALRERLGSIAAERAKSLFTFDKKVEILGKYLQSLGIPSARRSQVAAEAVLQGVRQD